MRRIPPPPGIQYDGWIQAVRLHYHAGDRYDLHDHGYGELFWIEHGVAIHTVNGIRNELQAGMLTVLRPTDRHEFATATGFVMVNVVHRQELISQLGERFGAEASSWPWDDAPLLPFQAALTPTHIERLQAAVEEIAGDASRLAAEGFLIDLLRLLRRLRSSIDQPSWLERALERFASTGGLMAGPGELVRLCGRSPAHVNRAVRAAHGCTVTELTNGIRLDLAARQLKLSRDGITEIAAGSGFASLAHFYRAFAARFGTTPRRFRIGHQAVARTVPERSRADLPVRVDRPQPRR